MNLILPEARMGVSRSIAELKDAQGRPGIQILTIDHMVLIHIWKHTEVNGRVQSEKFYTVELPAKTAAQMADAIHQASVMAGIVGDSPMPVRLPGLPVGR